MVKARSGVVGCYAYLGGALRGARVTVEAEHLEWADAARVAIQSNAELLAACKALVRSIEPNGFDPTTEDHFRAPLKAARAAIARAEGK